MSIKLRNGIGLLAGASGSGKTSHARAVVNIMPDYFEFSISATTREIRSYEKDGVDYYFMSVDEFLKKVRNGEFVEYVGPDNSQSENYYGTLKSEIVRIDDLGKFAILDTDLKGLESVKKLFPCDSCCGYLFAKNETRHRRLNDRGSTRDRNIEDLLTRLKLGDIQDEAASTESYKKNLLDFWFENEDGFFDEVSNRIIERFKSFVEQKVGTSSLPSI